jgi:hypothetical protein
MVDFSIYLVKTIKSIKIRYGEEYEVNATCLKLISI